MNEKKTLLTIVIPCYNGEKYINRCASSLRNLRDDISVLFVNDGSTDSTEKLIGDWVKILPNSRLLTKQNGGYSSAINFGLDNCKSEYVMLMGVDDEIVSDKINHICDNLKINSPDILCFSTIRVFDDKNPPKREKDIITEYSKCGYYEGNLFNVCKTIGKDSWILFTRDTSRCYKMSRIGNLRYYGKIGVSADGCFACLVANKSTSFEFVNEDAYLWHLHSDSVSGREISLERVVDESEVWCSFFAQYLRNNEETNIPLQIINYIFAYKKVVIKLKQKGAYEIRDKHERNIKSIIEWCLKKYPLPMKMRIALKFSGIYLLFCKLLKR